MEVQIVRQGSSSKRRHEPLVYLPCSAPAIPSTKNRCNPKNSTTVGRSDSVAAAHIAVQLVEYCPIKAYIPTVTVRKSGRPKVKTNGIKKLFQASMNSNSATV